MYTITVLYCHPTLPTSPKYTALPQTHRSTLTTWDMHILTHSQHPSPLIDWTNAPLSLPHLHPCLHLAHLHSPLTIDIHLTDRCCSHWHLNWTHSITLTCSSTAFNMTNHDCLPMTLTATWEASLTNLILHTYSVFLIHIIADMQQISADYEH